MKDCSLHLLLNNYIIIYSTMKSSKNETPLIHLLSMENRIPITLMDATKPIYDPITQTSIYNMGGQTTSCSKGTDGTEPKNEADRVMDDA